VSEACTHAIEAHTAEHLTPTEVYVVLKNNKGAQLLATNPALAPRLDFTAPTDGDFTLVVEHLHAWGGPDEVYRLRIWQTLFPSSVPCGELDFALLARRFRLSGGAIRNIIVSAAFLAAANGGMVTMEYLLHGARREMQKMGRLVKESDLRV